MHKKPLPIARSTWYLRLKWDSATGRMSFFVIMGLAGTPALILECAHRCCELHHYTPADAHTQGAGGHLLQSRPCQCLYRNGYTTSYHLSHLRNHRISADCAVAGGAGPSLICQLRTSSESLG